MTQTATTIAAVTVYGIGIIIAYHGFTHKSEWRHTLGLVIMIAAGLVAGNSIG